MTVPPSQRGGHQCCYWCLNQFNFLCKGSKLGEGTWSAQEQFSVTHDQMSPGWVGMCVWLLLAQLTQATSNRDGRCDTTITVPPIPILPHEVSYLVPRKSNTILNSCYVFWCTWNIWNICAVRGCFPRLQLDVTSNPRMWTWFWL